jgi:hypothetical protein
MREGRVGGSPIPPIYIFKVNLSSYYLLLLTTTR